MVIAAALIVMQPLKHLLNRAREDHRGTYAVSGIQRIVQILDVKVDPEAGLEVAVHHHRNLCIHNRGSCKAAADRCEYLFRINTGHRCQLISLSARCDVHSHDHLVRKLCGVACAVYFTAVDHRTAHHAQELLILVKHSLRTAAHNGKRSVDRLRLAAGDRCIHHVDAALCTFFSNILGLKGSDGAHVDDVKAFLCTFCNAALVKYCSAYMR